MREKLPNYLSWEQVAAELEQRVESLTDECKLLELRVEALADELKRQQLRNDRLTADLCRSAEERGIAVDKHRAAEADLAKCSAPQGRMR